MFDSNEHEGNSIEDLNSFARFFNRFLGIIAGICILTVTGLIILFEIFGRASNFFSSPFIVFPGILLNLAALYWLLSAYKNKYKIGNIISRHYSIEKNQFEGLAIIIFIIIAWLFLIIISESMFERIFFTLISLPGLIVGYINLS